MTTSVIGVAPTTHHAPLAPVTAHDPLHHPDDVPQVPAIIDAQAAVETARQRRAELIELTEELSVLTNALADRTAIIAELLQDPAANVEEILRHQANIATLRDRIDDLQARIDLAALRANQADLAVLEANARVEAELAQRDVSWLSHRTLFLQMADALASIQNGFVRETQDAAQEFLAFFRGWADIDSMLSSAIKADTAKDKEGYVVVRFDDMRTALALFMQDWADKELGTFPSREDAERFLRDTGLIEMDFPIRQDGGEWKIGFPIHIALAQYESMPPEPLKTPPNPTPPNYVPEKANPISWNNAEYQAWLSGKNNRQESLQNNSRVMVERLSRVNQIFDNLQNVYSQAQDSIAEADRVAAQAL